MSELKWVKTTFGELKAGDVFARWSDWQDERLMFACLKSSAKGAVEVFIRTEKESSGMFRSLDTVYRLVSPEREALEEIVAMTCDENDLDDLIATVRATFNIAKAALEVK